MVVLMSSVKRNRERTGKPRATNVTITPWLARKGARDRDLHVAKLLRNAKVAVSVMLALLIMALALPRGREAYAFRAELMDIEINSLLGRDSYSNWC